MSTVIFELSKYNVLYYCEHCHKFYTIIGGNKDVKQGKDIYGFDTMKIEFLTDFGDIVNLNYNSGKMECPNCKNLNNYGITIEPWIRELFFKVKGN